MMSTMVIAGLIAVSLIAWFISVYNALIQKIEAIRNSERQIDIELDRRFKVFDNLIKILNKYMNYEQTTLKDVTALRQQSLQAQQRGDKSAHIQAEEQLSKIAQSVPAVLQVAFEQYPDLKADAHASKLQEEIVSTENRLAYAKQAYNDAVERYRAFKQSFLQSFVVAMCRSKLDIDTPYWNIATEQRQQLEQYQING